MARRKLVGSWWWPFWVLVIAALFTWILVTALDDPGRWDQPASSAPARTFDPGGRHA